MNETTFDMGRTVQCDSACGADWTDRPESGGILFGGKGMCPDCAPRVEASAVRYGEGEYIHGRCPAGVSFADWIRQVRAETPGGNTVTIRSGWPGQ